MEVARTLLKEVTGVNPIQSSIRNCHRVGDGRILLEFLYAGEQNQMTDILDFRHRKKMFDLGVFINIFQTKHDRHMFYLARKLKKAKIVSRAFPNRQAVTVVVHNNKRVKINRVADLQQLCQQPLSSIVGSSAMETSCDSGMD